MKSTADGGETDFRRRLAEALAPVSPAGSPPGSAHEDTQAGPRLQTAPALAYGRHRGPPPADVRQAAVAVVWLEDAGRERLPLTMRPLSLRHHAGQICFPGGRIEAGESPEEAAIREFGEELGFIPERMTLCGRFAPTYVYASNNLVHPIVFTAAAPVEPWRPDRNEVQRVIELPLQCLLDPAAFSIERRYRPVVRRGRPAGGYYFSALTCRPGNECIWGATALWLYEMHLRLRRPGSQQTKLH